MTEELPRTRWESADSAGYARHFADLIASGADVSGEARLADALTDRGARILDAGAGMGRIGAALAAAGHEVLAVEKDAGLVAELARHYPDLPHLCSDLLALDPDRLHEAGHRADFDLIVLVGNVMVLLAPGTERPVLERMRALLAPGGRILAGFHPAPAIPAARAYRFEEFAADAAAAGLAVQHRFGSYELAPPSEDYCVAVLTAAD